VGFTWCRSSSTVAAAHTASSSTPSITGPVSVRAMFTIFCTDSRARLSVDGTVVCASADTQTNNPNSGHPCRQAFVMPHPEPKTSRAR
jgi:hypothetical protein